MNSLTEVTRHDRPVTKRLPVHPLFDHEQGSALATAHLLEHGHRRIGFIPPPREIPTVALKIHRIRACTHRSRNPTPDGADGDVGWLRVDSPVPGSANLRGTLQCMTSSHSFSQTLHHRDRSIFVRRRGSDCSRGSDGSNAYARRVTTDVESHAVVIDVERLRMVPQVELARLAHSRFCPTR